MALTRHPVPTSPPGAVRPRAPEGIFATKKGKIGRALRLTRWGMVWERGARAFWPLLALLAFLFAVLALGGVESLPTIALPWLGVAAMAALIVAAIVGGLRYRRVRESEALERLDRTLPGRPLAALGDHAVLG
ncbi:MAG: DUF4175 family protein, partial [Paracoccus sp. (in: a-proteobacteria)]|uniref:DUF4175 family protein n=1 Tax=Paracoccus sp. TaxID=267 RepID=UPI004058F184